MGRKKQHKSQPKATNATATANGLEKMTSRLDYEHPMLNPMLMEKILEYGDPDVNELKSLRSVCKLWNELTLPKWRETAVLTLVPVSPLFDHPHPGMGVLEYFKAYQNPKSPFKFSEYPFSRYTFTLFNIDINTCDRNGTDSKLFWDVIGQLMKYVHFKKCTIERSADKPFMQLLIRKLPNVEHLGITETRIKSRRPAVVGGFQRDSFRSCHNKLKTLTIEGLPPVDLKQLFIYAPYLETINGFDSGTNKNILHDFGFVSTEMSGALSIELSLSRSSRLRILPNLKHLDLINTGCYVAPFEVRSILESLQQSKLETITMALGVDWYQVGAVPADGNLGHIFQSQTETLQVVKLFKPQIKPPFKRFIHGTQMAGLREIHLWGLIVSNFNFLGSVPNLKVLYINLNCFERREQLKQMFRKERFYKPQLQYKLVKVDLVKKTDRNATRNLLLPELENFHIDYAFPEKSWRELGKWMPNLKVLETILTKETVSVVCGQWKDLRELVCLHESVIQDSDIVCHRSKDTIGNLKDLEKFQLDALCGVSTLSDTSAFNGILKMSALKSVKICVGKKMSQKAENILKERITDCRVIRNYEGGNGCNSSYDCCDRLEFKRDAQNGLPTELNRYIDSSSDSD